ncbi:MAG: type IX secretion system sortase PorU [Ignavibacteriales bacterium]|nr:type IX secretion system sortase PorU [Ignavibacteriales bacterium]
MRKFFLAFALATIGQQSTQAQASDSPLAQGTWYRFEVRETGMYKLDQKFFTDAGITTNAIANIRSVRVFGNGGRELPENLNSPRPNGLEEIARHVVDANNDGVFDASDYVVFYGTSTRGWNYNPSTKTYGHYINHYAETNYYFVTFGGANGIQMDSIPSLTGGTPFLPSHFQEKMLIEQERFNLVRSGRQWVGQSFDYLENNGVYVTTLSGHVSTEPTLYKAVVLSRSGTIDTFRVYESDVPLGSPILMGRVDVNSIDQVGDYAYRTPVLSFLRPAGTPLTNDRSTLKVVFGTRNQAAKGWLDWVEIHYRRRFVAVGDILLFSSPDTGSVVKYTVRNLTDRTTSVFDVTTHNSVKRIVQLDFSTADPSIVTFQLPHTANTVREFAVVGTGGFKTPANPKKLENSNIHNIVPGADFLILLPPEFLMEAARLKAHREKIDSLKTVVVNLEHVFNEFSGGLLDPMAIRDFLKYARTYWSLKPGYVLFFGGGHYDYKNISTSARNWLPPYETLESNYQINSYASDDHFLMLDPANNRISLASGRLPARSVSEAATMVDKIIAYETTVPFDTWRNRITYVADDGLTSTGRDEGSLHNGQAEDLAKFFTPPSFEQKKIYLIEYPTVSSATGRRKPEANKAIVNAFNAGSLVINYTGHGNPKLWAHEAVFTREGDISQLTNKDKLTFVVAATCNYAQYDDPLDQSSGEILLVKEQGGAIGVVSATRPVYSDQNSTLNNTYYSHLFQRDTLGRPARLGDAMRQTKQSLTDINDIKYNLFADPTLRLNMPRSVASVDSVNGTSTAQLVPMQSLGKVNVSGNVKRPNGTPWTGFNGRGLIEVLDAKRQIVVNEWGGFTYDVIGSILYRGEISVVNGSFQSVFPLPKDVSFGARSRISLYAWSDSTDAIGFTENVTIASSDSTALPDSVGPQIAIYFDDKAFRPGDVITPNSTLLVDLSDENGINTSIAGVGHRLQAVLSSQSAPIDLMDYYRSNLDTYQSGQVRYPLANLAEGRHSVTVKAWDTYNNSTESEVFFEVRATTDLAIYHVVNFPNPFSVSTVFTFQRNFTEPIDVEVKIYTIVGRLIQTVNSYSLADRFAQIPWDGRDVDGNELANGVYFYKVIAKTLDRQKSVEVIGKLAVLR